MASKFRFCIDAGHGGKDPGAVRGELQEKNAALAIALMLGRELISRGQEVVYTREEDEFVELKERCQFSNVYNCDYFVSIHLNSADNATAHGIETWYGSNKKLAQNVQLALLGVTKRADRGIKKGDFYVLKHTKAPAILIEVGFISNEEESKVLFDEEQQHVMAVAIATALTINIKKAP